MPRLHLVPCILQELVSHGYVVITPGHPYIADTVIFEDGTEAFLKAERDETLFETAFQDAQFVLSKLHEIQSLIPSINLAEIGMVGHSLGGATTMKTTRINQYVKAGVSLDGPTSNNIYEYNGEVCKITSMNDNIKLDNGSAIDKPFMHVFADKPICDHSTIHLKNKNFKAVIKGTPHNSFADHGILKDKIAIFKTKKWDLGAGHSEASSYQPEIIQLIRSFFDKFLKGKKCIDLMQLNSDSVTIEEGKD